MLTIGIVGLGLIGGSLAKAYKRMGEGARILAYDIEPSVLGFAKLCGAVDGDLTRESLPQCDCVFVGLYPDASIEYIKENAPYFNKNGWVMDLCGIKEKVCDVGFALAKEHGFTFIGGHPMAGTHLSGFAAAKETLFEKACMVIVPPVYDDMAFLEEIKAFLRPAGFTRISVTTAAEHDKTIAFTSQLAHVVSNAFIKSPTARKHAGFSAGSYRDLTRVAWLNPAMWSELFIDNKEPLVYEIDTLIESLAQYRDAITAGDYDTLYRLLDEGRRIKEEVDG